MSETYTITKPIPQKARQRAKQNKKNTSYKKRIRLASARQILKKFKQPSRVVKQSAPVQTQGITKVFGAPMTSMEMNNNSGFEEVNIPSFEPDPIDVNFDGGDMGDMGIFGVDERRRKKE